MDVETYMIMYSAIHDFCTSQKAISSSNRGVIGGAHRGAHLIGEELYVKLSAYLQQTLSTMHERAETLTNEQLLDYYNVQWSRFIACSRFNHYLWAWLNRHWIAREWDEGKKVDSIFDLHLRRWKLEMLDTMHENLARALLDLIRRQRDGEYVEQLPRKSFINSISEFANSKSSK
jgi:cullin 1